MVDAFVVGFQRIANRRLAEVADDAGGDVLVGQLAPGGVQAGLGEAGAVQCQGQFARLLAGEFAWAGEYGDQCGQGVAVATDEVREVLEVVLGLLRVAVAAPRAEQGVGVGGDVDGRCAGALAAVQDLAQVRALGEPLRDLSQRQLPQVGDESFR